MQLDSLLRSLVTDRYLQWPIWSRQGLFSVPLWCHTSLEGIMQLYTLLRGNWKINGLLRVQRLTPRMLSIKTRRFMVRNAKFMMSAWRPYWISDCAQNSGDNLLQTNEPTRTNFYHLTYFGKEDGRIKIYCWYSNLRENTREQRKTCLIPG
jgi:hypothetical protein